MPNRLKISPAHPTCEGFRLIKIWQEKILLNMLDISSEAGIIAVVEPWGAQVLEAAFGVVGIFIPVR
jgi:hypothetical protein